MPSSRRRLRAALLRQQIAAYLLKYQGGKILAAWRIALKNPRIPE
jgi:hypothetical protein